LAPDAFKKAHTTHRTDGYCQFLGRLARVDEVCTLAKELIGEGVDVLKGMATGGNMMVTTRAFSPTDFKLPVEAFVQYLKAIAPAEGFDDVFYPGKIEYRPSKGRREGIPIEDTTWRRSAITARFGISASRPMPLA
jgi:hypothetical protein